MSRYHVPDRLLSAARQREPLPVAVVAAHSAVAMESARRAQQYGVMTPVLVGDPGVIHLLAGAMDWPLDEVRLVPAEDEAEAARRAVALARSGEVGALMKGHIHTDTLMLAALDRTAGLRAGRRFTHAFHMTIPGWRNELIISDAAVNIAPDLDTKLDIIRNAVGLAQALGVERPKVALLSCTEEASERVPSSMDAAELTRRCAAGAVKDAVVYGPLAFDLAVSREATRIKGSDNPIGGRADVVVVPSVETGNTLFKAMVHFLNTTAAGIVLGAAVPILLTSRADPAEARVASAALARILVADRWRRTAARPAQARDHPELRA
jgi:phosphate acetyltransferase